MYEDDDARTVASSEGDMPSDEFDARYGLTDPAASVSSAALGLALAVASSSVPAFRIVSADEVDRIASLPACPSSSKNLAASLTSQCAATRRRSISSGF